jgi:hypothetical protein
VAKPFHRALLPQVLDDLRALADIDDALVDAGLQAVTDLARRRKTGKALGARHVSGDLSGCRRLRFDLPGHKSERFRVIYRLQPNDTRPDTVEIISIGPRGGHAATKQPSPASPTPDPGKLLRPQGIVC